MPEDTSIHLNQWKDLAYFWSLWIRYILKSIDLFLFLIYMRMNMFLYVWNHLILWFLSIAYLYLLSTFPISHLGVRVICNWFLFIVKGRDRGSFFPPQYEYPIDLASFLEKIIFLHLLQWHLCCKSDDCICVGLYLKPLVFSICLFVYLSILVTKHPVLITVDFKYLLVSVSWYPPNLFFFKIVFIILGSLPFHLNL